jgi:hypothetical protein
LIPSEEKRKFDKYLILLIAASLIIGSVSLIYPFGRDQGIYSYVAKLILNGKIDYKYSYNLRPPATHYTFALGQLLFGESFLGMRIFDLIWQIITAVFIYLTSRKFIKNSLICLISATLYIFLHYRLSYWHTLQTEGFMNLPIVVFVYLILRNIETVNQERLKIFITGIFIGIVVLYKGSIFPLIILIFIWIYFSGNYDIKKRLSNLSVYALGLISIIFFTVLIYLLNNAFAQFWEIQSVQIPRYAKIGFQTESLGFIIDNIIRLFCGSVYSPLIVLSLITLFVLFRTKKLNSKYTLIYLWLAGSVISLIIQWKFFTYHFLIIIPPLCILASISYSLFIQNSKFNLKYIKFFGLIALILFTAFAFKPYQDSYKNLYSFISGKENIEKIYEKIGVTSDSVYTIQKINLLCRKINELTYEKDKIFIWGIEPVIYYKSKRDCVSRFIYNTPLYWKGENKDYQNELMNEVTKENPKLILVAQNDPMFNITGYNEDSEKLLDRFPEFKTFIATKYKLTEQLCDFSIYEQKLELNH